MRSREKKRLARFKRLEPLPVRENLERVFSEIGLAPAVDVETEARTKGSK